MRVILELLPSGTGRVTGTLRTDWANPPVPFDGWLELMRLLEAVPLDPSDSTILGDPHQPSFALPDSRSAESRQPMEEP